MSPLSLPRPVRIELICFAALGIVVSLQWASLVSHPPAARIALAVALATGAGAGLAAIGRLPRPRATRWALAAAAGVLAICLGLVVVGLPARLLLPGHWGELGSNVDRSLNGVTDVPVPYAGADTWTRLVILLAAPLSVGIAAFAAFWPTRRRAAGRICALVLLVALYLVAVAWARPGRQLAGGALLVILICAWLWLPSIERGRWSAASFAIAAAALVAVPATALVDPGRALLDYRHWNLLSANGVSFRWDQSYGPLSWPQKGTLLLEIASDKVHYWKATNLDNFDGVRWTRSSAPETEPALGEPRKFHPKGTDPSPDAEWVDRINLEDRGLTSDSAIGAGTILALRRTAARPNPDGVWEMTNELHPGSTYTALVYDPKPSATEMRAAGTAYPAAAARYVSFALSGPAGPLSVDAPFWRSSGPQSIEGRVRGTPYEPMYALARHLATGATTPYDAATRIELYLRANLAYRQDVPNHAYPLPDFLSVDRAGYCQQFSGTMALMLRMLGIPSRVATGFAPGGRDPEQGGWMVDDTDAHDWVEVFFPDIGWVTFDPTPAASPAATQLADNALGVTLPGTPEDKITPQDAPAPPGGKAAPEPKQGIRAPGAAKGGGSGPGAATLLALVAGAAALGALAAYGARARHRARLRPDELADGELRELDRALARLGSPLPPGTTLRGARELLEELAGPAGARYAARLEAHRYRDPSAAPPGVGDRRALRRVLLRTGGARSALRVLLALPPGGPAIRRRGRADRMTSRSARRPGPPSASASAAPGSAR